MKYNKFIVAAIGLSCFCQASFGMEREELSWEGEKFIAIRGKTQPAFDLWVPAAQYSADAKWLAELNDTAAKRAKLDDFLFAASLSDVRNALRSPEYIDLILTCYACFRFILELHELPLPIRSNCSPKLLGSFDVGRVQRTDSLYPSPGTKTFIRRRFVTRTEWDKFAGTCYFGKAISAIEDDDVVRYESPDSDRMTTLVNFF
jgi:hypothetical protein